jgi:hypothetical protein
MPWYNSDFSFVFNCFAHLMVVVGFVTVVGAVSWWVFCQTFKFVDRVVNDYHYD